MTKRSREPWEVVYNVENDAHYVKIWGRYVTDSETGNPSPYRLNKYQKQDDRRYLASSQPPAYRSYDHAKHHTNGL